jgi:hypothetical protein
MLLRSTVGNGITNKKFQQELICGPTATLSVATQSYFVFLFFSWPQHKGLGKKKLTMLETFTPL